MRLIKVAGWLALAVFSSQIWAIEDTPENREREARRYEQQFDSYEVFQLVLSAQLDAELKGENHLKPVIIKFISEEVITPDELRQYYHKMYVEKFTAGELKALADFYETPEGRSTLKKLSEVMSSASKEITPIIEKRSKEKEWRFVQRLGEFYDKNPELRPKD